MKKMTILQNARLYAGIASNMVANLMSSLTSKSRHPYKLRVRIHGSPTLRKYVLLDKECYDGLMELGFKDDDITLEAPQSGATGTNYMMYAIGDRTINSKVENRSAPKFFIGPGYYRARQCTATPRARETIFIDMRRQSFTPCKVMKNYGKPVFYL